MCEHSEKIDEIATALSEFQGKVKNPAKNKTVKVYSKRTQRTYTFDYATFDSVLESTRPLLAECGLAVVQFPATTEKGNVEVTTLLTHKSGQWMRGALIMCSDEPGPQAMGSLISYARRYSLVSVLGISAEEDDDANIAEGNDVQAQQKAAPSPADVEYVPSAKIEEFRANLRKTFPANDQMKRAGEIIIKHGVNLRDRETPVLVSTFEKIRSDLQLLYESIKKKSELEAA